MCIRDSWTVMLALGVGSGCTAGFGALLAELYPTEVRTAAMGATYNLARTAQLATPVIVALAINRSGLAGGLGVPCVLALATASFFFNDTATTEIYTRSLVGSVRCV